MDSAFSIHMTKKIKDFLSVKALERENVSFGDGKKGYYGH